jgi:hypothetical protein
MKIIDKIKIESPCLITEFKNHTLIKNDLLKLINDSKDQSHKWTQIDNYFSDNYTTDWHMNDNTERPWVKFFFSHITEHLNNIVKSLGYTYDSITGKIFGIKGKEIIAKHQYIVITGNKKFKGNLLGHHFAWYIIYGNVDFQELDHINRNKLDNRLENLRIITAKENSYNRTKSVSSRNSYKGIVQKPNNKYYASISKDKIKSEIGPFDTEEEAAIPEEKPYADLDKNHVDWLNSIKQNRSNKIIYNPWCRNV